MRDKEREIEQYSFSRIIFNKIIRKNYILLFFFLRIIFYLGFLSYIFHRLINKPYTGNYLFANQEGGRKRLQIISSIIKNYKKKKISILEIGVYCGQTTVHLCSVLEKKKINYVYVDPFKTYELKNKIMDYQVKKMMESLNNKKAYNLFIYNINILKKKNKDLSFIEKINSAKEFYKKNKKKYDFIIIDGDHCFKNVIIDIKNCIKFCKNGGYIIGDDYELEAEKLSFKELKKISNKDLTYCPKNKKYFHPGVTLAIKTYFRNLKSKNGIYAIQKVNKKIIDIFKS